MTVMLLGSYHFYTKQNLFRVHEDVTTADRQRDVAEVVDCLASYQPTHVAVELLASDQEAVDAQYRQFLEGQWDLPPNERYQLGFRVAQRMRLPCVEAIDFKNEADSLSIGDVMDTAKATTPELYAWLMEMGQQRNQVMQDRIHHESMRAVLRWMNQPEELTGVLPFYLAMTQIRDANGRRVGLEWVATWQARNLTIYANLRERMKPDDRWLVIYGADHVAPLIQFLEDSREVDLVAVSDFLS
ncbi:hypothetical protein HIJ39_13935 [Sulfobacillus sp. DSM 109850]|uniref:Haem-binding uptake Tiki superfamily ChaN domain-containing protein n=2 Tax=Sulfobacillus harzensis TaxID=2729629 RepID=A0A7Y0L512_9FIRM|nr:hypothetical protein [Sulfobacillus harzensis]